MMHENRGDYEIYPSDLLHSWTGSISSVLYLAYSLRCYISAQHRVLIYSLLSILFKNERFNLAILLTDISFGHTASHA